jgi:hypothetical protein
VFVTRCLRRILNVKRLGKISKEELWQRTKQTPVKQQIKKRKWHWIGPTLRRPQGAVERHALDWNTWGTRKRGRPRTTWKRTTAGELQKVGRSWKEAKGLALDTTKWKSLMNVLYST